MGRSVIGTKTMLTGQTVGISWLGWRLVGAGGTPLVLPDTPDNSGICFFRHLQVQNDKPR
jgi:hypothetical protein